MRQLLLAACLLMPLLLPVAAMAQPLVQSQEGIALQNEIDQLQAQLQQLQANAGNNGSSVLGGGNSQPAPAPSQSSSAPPAGGMVASLLTQVQQLQTQVQVLNGRVDTLQNQVAQQNAQTQKQIGDINFKLSGSATPGAPVSPGTPPAPPGTAPTAPGLSPPAAPASLPAPAASPKAQLHAALLAYEHKDFANAATMAQAVAQIKTAPEAYRAQYLVAQSETASGRYQDAAIAYDDTYNMNRTGVYAPPALLGLASSLAAINQNEAACDTLASLKSQFPTPPAGMQPRIDAVAKKASCQ